MDASTFSMKASEMLTPWWRFKAFMFWSPVGFRISTNGMMSGCETSRNAA